MHIVAVVEHNVLPQLSLYLAYLFFHIYHTVTLTLSLSHSYTHSITHLFVPSSHRHLPMLTHLTLTLLPAFPPTYLTGELVHTLHIHPPPIAHSFHPLLAVFALSLAHSLPIDARLRFHVLGVADAEPLSNQALAADLGHCRGSDPFDESLGSAAWQSSARLCVSASETHTPHLLCTGHLERIPMYVRGHGFVHALVCVCVFCVCVCGSCVCLRVCVCPSVYFYLFIYFVHVIFLLLVYVSHSCTHTYIYVRSDHHLSIVERAQSRRCAASNGFETLEHFFVLGFAGVRT
jgi:hypothetical protein